MRAATGSAVSSAASARTFQLAQEVIELASRARWRTGRHVTELELSAALSISRTPVRAALKLLEQHGCMEGRPNRGFFLVQDGETLTPLAPTAPATVDSLLEGRIIGDHTSGRLPARITVGLLVEQYGVRRATLERVLGKLVAERLMTREAGHQWRFVPSLEGEAGVRASYEMRLLLEPGALLLPGARAEPHTVARQTKLHEEMLARLRGPRRGRTLPSPASVVELDANFHESIAAFSGNPFVIGVVANQNALRRLLEFDSYHDAPRVAAWMREHLAILQALAVSDLTRASRLLHDHLARAARVAAAKLLAPPVRSKRKRVGD